MEHVYEELLVSSALFSGGISDVMPYDIRKVEINKMKHGISDLDFTEFL